MFLLGALSMAPLFPKKRTFWRVLYTFLKNIEALAETGGDRK